MGTVEDVKARVDVVDLVGSYVSLSKAGRNFKALCPFHQEKTASFYVFPDRQSWRCFGCGEGGDAIAFLMKRESIDFGEALRTLADRVGVQVGRRRTEAESKRDSRPYEVNREAAAYFRRLLADDPPAAPARDYVSGRGISDAAVSEFQLGYSGHGLKKYMTEQGFSDRDLLAVGLLREKESGTYEFFRNRLMFPVRDVKGRTIGFGARALDDSTPKYLNTPQTALFDKSTVLYAIDMAKDAIRESNRVVIVEGYMDVIAAHQHGFRNVVASMGTSLSDKQVKAIKGLTRNIVLALDPDAAGDAATLRGIDVARRTLDREALEVRNALGGTSRLRADLRVLSLPRGKDPDALIREDPASWQALVDSATPLVEHLIAVVTSNLDVSRPEGKSAASEQLLPLIAELDSEIDREYYLNRLATILGVSPRKLAEISATMHSPRASRQRRYDGRETAGPRPPSQARYGDPLEECCLSILLQHSELKDKAASVEADCFELSENREVFRALCEAGDYDDMVECLSEELQEHLQRLVGTARPPASPQTAEAELARCLCRLEERRLRVEGETLTAEYLAAVQEGIQPDDEYAASLEARQLEVNARLVERMRERTGGSTQGREDL